MRSEGLHNKVMVSLWVNHVPFFLDIFFQQFTGTLYFFSAIAISIRLNLTTVNWLGNFKAVKVFLTLSHFSLALLGYYRLLQCHLLSNPIFSTFFIRIYLPLFSYYITVIFSSVLVHMRKWIAFIWYFFSTTSRVQLVIIQRD